MPQTEQQKIRSLCQSIPVIVKIAPALPREASEEYEDFRGVDLEPGNISRFVNDLRVKDVAGDLRRMNHPLLNERPDA